jgi:hypothetical protein
MAQTSPAPRFIRKHSAFEARARAIGAAWSVRCGRRESDACPMERRVASRHSPAAVQEVGKSRWRQIVGDPLALEPDALDGEWTLADPGEICEDLPPFPPTPWSFWRDDFPQLVEVLRVWIVLGVVLFRSQVLFHR